MTVVVAQESALGSVPPSVRRWVYLGEDPSWALTAEGTVLAAAERLEVGDALQRHAAALRGPYLDWIADLGVRSGTHEWWSTELAAKNVYTFLFQRICAAAVAMDVLEDELLVVCSTPALAATVAGVARGRGLEVDVRTTSNRLSRLIRETGYGVVRGTPQPRPPQPALDGRAHDTLLVTWADDRNFDAEGRYRDPHFGPLPRLLRDSGLQVSLLARVLPTAPYRATVRQLRACGERVLLPESFLTASDRRAAWRAARSFDPGIPDDAEVGQVPAAPLARELCVQQRMQHAESLRYRPLVRRMAEAGISPSRIVVPWEGHAWETTLFAATREYWPETEVVAYDNLNFSRFALSLYPGRAELGIRPLPDRVVTNGETFARVLEDQGFPPQLIRTGCALRHADLYDGDGLKRAPRGDAQFVLAAGSIDAPQTIEMLCAAEEAFGDDLLVKLHPASDVARIRQSAPAGVRYADRPLGELLANARAMTYTYSIVPYEALAAGVPPIFFRSAALIDLDQLEPTPAIHWSAGRPAELRDALSAAEEQSGTDAWQAEARAVVRAALTPPSTSCVKAFVGDV